MHQGEIIKVCKVNMIFLFVKPINMNINLHGDFNLYINQSIKCNLNKNTANINDFK